MGDQGDVFNNVVLYILTLSIEQRITSEIKFTQSMKIFPEFKLIHFGDVLPNQDITKSVKICQYEFQEPICSLFFFFIRPKLLGQMYWTR